MAEWQLQGLPGLPGLLALHWSVERKVLAPPGPSTEH